MTEISPEIPQKVLDLIGEKQYEQESDFEIHMAYVNNTCACICIPTAGPLSSSY